MYSNIDENLVREHFKRLTNELVKQNKTITSMESITGGLIASLITDTEGSSQILKGAFVTYSNEAKILQGVPRDIIEKFGVYSTETAYQMARACKYAYSSDISIGITGTTGNTDVNNIDSVQGEVYYSIISDKKNITGKFVMEPMGSRLQYKMFCAEFIYEKLFNEILCI